MILWLYLLDFRSSPIGYALDNCSLQIIYFTTVMYTYVSSSMERNFEQPHTALVSFQLTVTYLFIMMFLSSTQTYLPSQMTSEKASWMVVSSLNWATWYTRLESPVIASRNDTDTLEPIPNPTSLMPPSLIVWNGKLKWKNSICSSMIFDLISCNNVRNILSLMW